MKQCATPPPLTESRDAETIVAREAVNWQWLRHLHLDGSAGVRTQESQESLRRHLQLTPFCPEQPRLEVDDRILPARFDEDHPTTRLRDAKKLPHRSLDIRQMMEHIATEDDIDGAGREWETCRIRDRERNVRRNRATELQPGEREVAANDPTLPVGEAGDIRSLTRANLEDHPLICPEGRYKTLFTLPHQRVGHLPPEPLALNRLEVFELPTVYRALTSHQAPIPLNDLRRRPYAAAL